MIIASPHVNWNACLMAFYCALVVVHFLQLKVCGNHLLSKSISTTFPTVFAYSVSHILVIEYFKLFLDSYGDL